LGTGPDRRACPALSGIDERGPGAVRVTCPMQGRVALYPIAMEGSKDETT
jgi:hypothetical protein